MHQSSARQSRFVTVIDPDAVARVKELVLASRKIAITCHLSPDGDALGSTTALCSVLRALGKDATVVTADCPPKSLQFMPGVREIVVGTRQQEAAHRLFREADLLFCLDFNSLHRLDKLAECFESCQARRVIIDHHLDPDLPADVLISHPDISSTSALLYIFLYQAGWTRYLNRYSASDLYVGMMTDTGGFTYNSNDPDLYLIIHDLLQRGIDKDALYKIVMDTTSETSLRIIGYGQYRMDLLPDHQAAVIHLSREELDEFDYQKGDTEGLVNKPLALPEVTWSIFLREDSKDSVKVSMRSKGDFPVNLVCQNHFGGGGHVNAAGGDFHGPIDQALTFLLSIIPNYDSYLK